jgi:hypothetical protein
VALRFLRRVALCAATALALAACGAEAGPKGPDRSTPEAVFAHATSALSRGDLAALDAILSDAGRAQVRRDLEAWRAVLRDPATGPRVLARLPRDESAIRRALDGGLEDVLRLYVRADPHPAATAPPAERAPDATWASIDYVSSDGSRRRVVMTRGADGWRVDHLQL